MTYYVIERTDGGGYVAVPGAKRSYTQYLQRAWKFASRETADAERCPENEVVTGIGVNL